MPTLNSRRRASYFRHTLRKRGNSVESSFQSKLSFWALDESREFEEKGQLSYFIELPNIRIFVRYIAAKISHSSVSDFLLALGIEYSCVVTGASIAARYLLHALLGWRFLLLTVSSGWHSFFLEDSIGCLAFWIVLPMILASDKSCDLFLLEGWVERMMNLLRSFPSSQRPWGLFVDRSQQHRVASSQCDLPLSPSYTSDIIRRNEILAYVR